MAGEFQKLADEIYREKVLRARRTPPEERILEGPKLFDLACEFARAGIRAGRPDVSEAEVEECLRNRLRLQQRLENSRA